MTTVRSVQQIGIRSVGAELTDLQIRRRIELHTTDMMDKSRVGRDDEGTPMLGLPVGDSEQEEALRRVYVNASPEQRVALTVASAHIADALYTANGDGVSAVTSQFRTSFGQGAEVWAATTGSKRFDDLTTGVMYMAIDGVDQDVYGLAQELGTTLQQAKVIREDIAEFRNTIADWPEGAATQEFTWTEFKNGKAVEHHESLTREQAEAKMNELDMALSGLADIKQDYQLRMQDAMQKQQQAVQLLSNIMKNQHDTLKAIINNMRS